MDAIGFKLVWRCWSLAAAAAALCLWAPCVQTSPIARAETICILAEHDPALWARVRMFELAEREIDVACYAVGADHVSLAILAMLRDAADRGVCVRLLIDGIHDELPAAVRCHLRDHGVQIREYHPILLRRPDWLNFRLHDKLIVVDGEHAIVGSRNVENHHFGRGCNVFLDRDVYVRGDAARDAANYFACRWNGGDIREAGASGVAAAGDFLSACPTCGKRVEIDWSECCAAQAGCILDAERDRLLACLPSAEELNAALAETTHETGPVCFLHDSTDSPCWRTPGMEKDVVALIDRAECEIVIATPYIILSAEMRRAFKAALARGVAVRVLTNSSESTDVLLAHAAYENDKRGIARMGIRLWEFQGPEHFHEKTFVVDGRWTIVGSFNLDVRSQTHNTEVAMRIDDEAVAAHVLGSLEERFARALPIGRDGRAMEGALPFPGARSRRAALRVNRLLAPFVRPWL